jgi:glycosyltransferase involved in cell wall biosynthesis
VRVVIDAVPMQGDSLGIVVEHMLEGWLGLDSGDELHLVVGPDPQIAIPDGITVHHVKFGRKPFFSRLYAQSITIPRLCRSLDADIMLGTLPTTAMTPLPCPRAIIIYDLRYKIRPEGFTRKSRLFRNLSYRIGFGQFDAAVCISERTKRDLLRFYPRLWRRPLRTAHLGADHVDSWPVRRSGTPYAIAFSHYANKNVDLVIDAWALRHQQGESSLPLALVGVSGTERPRIQERINGLGLNGFVNVFLWMPIDTFRETFASASLVVFPSDFEGFGLPAAEAMRLGIPVVISPDLALLEVTNGHATVMEGETPEALVRAVQVAEGVTLQEIEAARRHAARFTWSNFAFSTRWLLAETVAGVAAPARRAAGRSLVPNFLRRDGGSAHPGPFRWLGAAVAGTLAVSGISAASIVLVDSKQSPSTHADQSTSTTQVTSRHRTNPGFVPLPTTTNPSGEGSTSTSSTPGQSSTPSAPGSSHTSGSGLSKVSVPSVSIPPVTMPTLTIPTLPLTALACSLGTTKTAPVSIPLQPCSVTASPSVCRCN